MVTTPYLIHRYLFFPIYIYDETLSLGMMRQKLITLDPTSWELAQKKKNFSAWVRQKLAEEAAKVTKEPRYSYYREYLEEKAKEDSE